MLSAILLGGCVSSSGTQPKTIGDTAVEGASPSTHAATEAPEDTSADATETEADASPSLASRTYRQTRAGINEAAMAPLKDMNLRREPIPPLLLEIKNPYAVPVETDCDAIATEIMALDALLGRDWDVPPPDKQKLSEQAAEGASTAFLETVASEASGLIPYRGVVRSLSGAERHRAKRRKAFERGSHRRTFLKGLGMAKTCPYPASPQELPDQNDQAKIVFR